MSTLIEQACSHLLGEAATFRISDAISLGSKFGFSVEQEDEILMFTSKPGDIGSGTPDPEHVIQGKNLVKAIKAKYKNISIDLDTIDEYVSIQVIFFTPPKYKLESDYEDLVRKMIKYLETKEDDRLFGQGVIVYDKRVTVSYGKMFYRLQFDTLTDLSSRDISKAAKALESELKKKFKLERFIENNKDRNFSVEADSKHVIILSSYLDNRK